MPFTIGLFIVPALLAVFLAVNMGGSGTAPSFSAAYGAHIIRLKHIPFLFGIMVCAGALLAGKEVSLTLGKGLLDSSLFSIKNTSIILLSTALSIFFANLLGIPQSTSQSTVLSIAGVASAMDALNTHKLFTEIIPTWLILPCISFVIMLLLLKFIFPYIKGKIVRYNLRQVSFNKDSSIRLVILLASCYVAFSIGANNVANAASPFAALMVNEFGAESGFAGLHISTVSVLILAPCFGLGSLLFGNKVTKVIGKGILDINSFHATVISVLVASLLIWASISKGIPTSLVQLNSAAFMALSMHQKGFKATIKNKTIKKSFVVWLLAPLFSFILSYTLVLILV